MLLIVLLFLAIAAVPLARGNLGALARMSFAHKWILGLAVVAQAVLIAWPGPPSGPRTAAHYGSYVLGIVFLVANRRIPGLWLVGIGALLNLTAIAANGGVMPASPHALATSGIPADVGGLYTNTAALEHPRLLVLGDVFAVPEGLPLANVFSIGDVCIALGVIVTVHRATGSRLVPSAQGAFVQLLTRRSFMRVWTAQVVSNLGDWIYWLAVSITLSERVQGPSFATALVILLVAQFVPSAVVGALFAGPLVDRYSRKALMVGSDLLRAAAIGSLLLVSEPSPAHFYVVAAFLGLFGAVFQPSLLASIPNVVREGEVVPAQAMVGATLHLAIMIGPAVGGYLIGILDPATVVGLNAISFATSALLIRGAKIRPHERSALSFGSQWRTLAEGVRHILASRLTRGIIMVVGLVFFGAATKAPLEPLFVRDVLVRGGELAERARVLGLITTAWGVGMLLGSIAAPALARRWRRERLFPITLAIVGLAILAVATTSDFSTVLFAWLVAGAANSIGNVSYETLLQERTPDAFRGRVFAATEAVTDGAFLSGALLAGLLGTWLSVSAVFGVVGGIMLLAALLGLRLLPTRASTPARPAATAAPDRAAS